MPGARCPGWLCSAARIWRSPAGAQGGRGGKRGCRSCRLSTARERECRLGHRHRAGGPQRPGLTGFTGFTRTIFFPFVRHGTVHTHAFAERGRGQKKSDQYVDGRGAGVAEHEIYDYTECEMNVREAQARSHSEPPRWGYGVLSCTYEAVKQQCEPWKMARRCATPAHPARELTVCSLEVTHTGEGWGAGAPPQQHHPCSAACSRHEPAAWAPFSTGSARERKQGITWGPGCMQGVCCPGNSTSRAGRQPRQRASLVL